MPHTSLGASPPVQRSCTLPQEGAAQAQRGGELRNALSGLLCESDVRLIRLRVKDPRRLAEPETRDSEVGGAQASHVRALLAGGRVYRGRQAPVSGAPSAATYLPGLWRQVPHWRQHPGWRVHAPLPGGL
jgi:hypothetical protein